MGYKVVTCRWGSVYTQEHVDKLYYRVKAKCSVDFDFYCFDNPDRSTWREAQKKHFRGLDDPDMRAQGAWNDYERDDCGGLTHYRKLLMFSKDLDERHRNGDRIFDLDDTILFLDLDVLILKDIAPFFELDNLNPWIVKSYWFDGEREEGEWQRQFYLRE